MAGQRGPEQDVPVRRGLPRQRAGAPWPPVGGAVGADDEVTVTPHVVSSGADADSAASRQTPSTAEPTRDVAAVDSAPVKPPRRGLPRRLGEQAAGPSPTPTAPSAVPIATSADEDSPRVDAPVSPGETTVRRRTGLPRPGGTATSALVAPSARASAQPDPDLPPAVASASPAERRSGLPRASGGRAPVPSGDGRGQTPAPPSPVGAAPSPTAPPTAPQPRPRPAAPAPAPVRAVAAVNEPRRIGRYTRTQWLGIVTIGGFGLLFTAAMIVLFTRWFVSLDFMRDYLATYPGETHLPEGAPVGLPAWLGWQHFLNAFFIVLIIRTGWQVRTQTRPPAMWTRNNNRLITTKNPPKKISLTLWAHLTFDILWLLNGVTFVVLLFVTGQWMRVVPTSWDVIPNAVSAALQYVSLNWPTENGWVNYNSLQVLAYFVTIFIAAPLAAITGIRMSGAWPRNATRLNKLYPVEWARAVHLPVMLYFVLFVIMHVALVFATGALRNLNHMYASQDAVNWTGFWTFFGSLVVMIGAVLAARPLVLAPIARLMGKVGR